MKRLLATFLLSAALASLLLGCQEAAVAPPATPGQVAPPAGPPAPGRQPRVEVVAGGLEVPWAIAFADEVPGLGRGSYLLFSERPGRLRLIVNGELQAEPLATLPVTAVGESGLMGLALDPAFATNGHLYVMYTYRVGVGLQNRISRLTVSGREARDEKVLLDGIPGGFIHDGGRLAFGPDGKLYATTGDAGRGELAQDRQSLAGKILRLDANGSVPVDNPFAGSPIFSYGHRNPEGLAWHPQTGRLYSTEHGPSGHDEVNRIRAGGNYGWPSVAGAGGRPPFVDPVHESGSDTWAPAGAAFYAGDLFPRWQNNLFFGALRGRHLHRLALGGQEGEQVVAAERLFVGEYGRIRAVAAGPDGALYFSTSNRDGRGQPTADDDRILRLVAGD